jgi:hypothetical protein
MGIGRRRRANLLRAKIKCGLKSKSRRVSWCNTYLAGSAYRAGGFLAQTK